MSIPINITSDLNSKSYETNIRIIIRMFTNEDEHQNNYSKNDIFISKSDIQMDANNYQPILLSRPKFTESVDMHSRNFKTSKVKIKISNLKYHGKIFSDFVSASSIMYKEVDIWLDTQSTEDASTSFKVYKGYVTRFTHNKTQCTVHIEDLVEKKLSKEVPTTIVEDENNEKYVNEPIPFVYGTLFKAPTVMDKGIVKADTEPVSLITSNEGEYAGIGSAFGYEGLGIFEGFGDNDAAYKSPLTIYMDDTALPVLKTQALAAFGTGSNTVQGDPQWYDESEASGPGVKGQVLVRNLETYSDNVLQCQSIIKPTQINGRNKISGEWLSAHGYMNDFTDDTAGWGGADKFSEEFVELLTDGDLIHTGGGSGSWNWNSSLGIKCSWWHTYTSYQGLLGLWRNINNARIQYTYDPTYNITRFGHYHYLAIGDKVLPRLHNYQDETGKMRSLFIFPLGTPSENNFAEATVKTNCKQVSLNTDLNTADIDKATEDSFNFQFKDIITMTDFASHANYNGYAVDEWGSVSNTEAPGFYNNPTITINNASSEIPMSSAVDASGDVVDPTLIGDDWQIYVQFSGDDWGIGNICFGFYHHLTNDSAWQLTHLDQEMNVDIDLKELTVYSIVEIEDTFEKKFYLDVRGRSSIEEGSADTVLTNPIEIIKDIAIREVGYGLSSAIDNDPYSPGYFPNAIDNHEGMHLAFSVNKKISIKKLIEEIAKSSTLCFPYFKRDGTFSAPSLKNKYSLSDYTSSTKSILIQNKDVIKYSFDLSPIEKVYTRVNIEYGYDYNGKKYSKRAEGKVIDILSDPGESIPFDHTALQTYKMDGEMLQSSAKFYGYDDKDSNSKDIKSKYIQTKDTAEIFKKKMFNYHRNQHLELKITLPLSYINIEVGHSIKFNELIEGIKAFGQDYTKVSNNQWYHNNLSAESAADADSLRQTHYGQFYYPLFFVTKVSKDLDSVSIEASRLHCLDSGYQDITEWLNAGLVDTSQIYNYGDYGYETDHFYSTAQQVVGCMDPVALNYDPDADIHDVSMCEYIVEEPPADDSEEEYDIVNPYPEFASHAGISLIENYSMPADQTWWDYDYNDYPIQGWTDKFITVKDLYLWVPIDKARFGYTSNMNPTETWYNEFIVEEINSQDDNSLINFFNEFVHPNENLKIGQEIAPIGGDWPGYWGNTHEWTTLNMSSNFHLRFDIMHPQNGNYEDMFLSQLSGSDNVPFADWLMYQYWGWSNTFDDYLTHGFIQRFVAMEIQIKDYRHYGIPEDAPGGIHVMESEIENILPPTLPQWIIEDYQGKITIALVVLNNHTATAETATKHNNMKLGWRIFPGHYENQEYMDSYDDFYDEWGRWVLGGDAGHWQDSDWNDFISIGWGYRFPGNETWQNFYYQKEVLQHIQNIDTYIGFLGGSHSADDVWMRINCAPYAYTGLHGLIDTCQNTSNNIVNNHIPKAFGLWNKYIQYVDAYYDSLYDGTDFPPEHVGEMGFVVYRGDFTEYIPPWWGYGDANGDGIVNILDIVAIVNYVLGNGEIAVEAAADFNYDGTTNILDIVAMVNFILGSGDPGGPG